MAFPPEPINFKNHPDSQKISYNSKINDDFS